MGLILPPDNSAELTQYRTTHSKRFDLGNGLHKIIHRLGRVHFQDDDGSWKDIDETLTTESGTGDTVCNSLPFRFRLLNRGVGYIYQSRSGGTVRVILRRVGATAISTNTPFTFTRQGNQVTFADVATDLDIAIKVTRGGLQVFRILKSANADKAWRWAITYDSAGQSKIGTDIQGRDDGGTGRWLRGLNITNGTPQDNGNGTFTYLCDEIWDGTVVTVDAETRLKTITNDPVYPVWIDPDISDHISTGNDDVQEFPDAPILQYDVAHTYSLKDHSMTLSLNYAFHPSVPAMRFQAVAIANGATIVSANLKMFLGFNYSALPCYIYGDAADSSAAWTTTNRPSQRTKTAASKYVAAASHVSVGNFDSFDIKNIVQEIVNRAGWASGQNMSFMLFPHTYPGSSPSKYMGWDMYEHSGTNEPVLEITLAASNTTYTVYSGPRPAVACIDSAIARSVKFLHIG